MCTVSTLMAEKAERTKHTKNLSLDGKGWSILIELPKFKIIDRWTRSDGSGRSIMAFSRKTGVVVSVYLERNPEFESMEECRDHYWDKASRSPLPKSDIERHSTKSMALVHWLDPSEPQQHINAYMYHDGACIDIHLSKGDYTPEDEPLIAAILDTVRFSSE